MQLIASFCIIIEQRRKEQSLTTEEKSNIIHVDFGMDPMLNKGDFVKLKESGHHGIVIDVKSRFESGPYKGQALFVDVAIPITTEDEDGAWDVMSNVYLEDVVRVVSKHPESFDGLEEDLFCESDFVFDEDDCE